MQCELLTQYAFLVMGSGSKQPIDDNLVLRMFIKICDSAWSLPLINHYSCAIILHKVATPWTFAF